METTTSFSFSSTGSDTGVLYNGTFKVKTLISRREQFIADQHRRDILGSNSDAAAPALVGEAFMLGQLKVRIVEAPKFWKDNGDGLDLLDGNIVAEVFELVMKAMDEKKAEFKAKVEQAKTELK